MTRRRRGPHQADSPSVSLEIAEAAADFEAVIGEELRSDGAVVDAFGNADEGEGREAVRLVDRELQAKRLEALLEGIGLLPMTCVAGVEPFFEDESERFLLAHWAHAESRCQNRALVSGSSAGRNQTLWLGAYSRISRY